MMKLFRVKKKKKCGHHRINTTVMSQWATELFGHLPGITLHKTFSKVLGFHKGTMSSIDKKREKKAAGLRPDQLWKSKGNNNNIQTTLRYKRNLQLQPAVISSTNCSSVWILACQTINTRFTSTRFTSFSRVCSENNNRSKAGGHENETMNWKMSNSLICC